MGQTEIPFFYNTNSTNGVELSDEIKKASGLERKVYDFFAANPDGKFIWSEVWTKLSEPNECSLKRALSNLVKKGWLLKTDVLRRSIANKKAHEHQLNTDLKND